MRIHTIAFSKDSPWLLMVAILLAIVFWIFSANMLIGVTAEMGIADLSELETEKGPFALKGQWEYYPARLLAPNECDPDEAHFIKLPGVIPPFQGLDTFGTFRLSILLPETGQWSIRIPFFLTAYRLFVNGEELGQVGQPGLTKEGTLPRYFHSIFTYRNDGKILEIVIHASNFHLRRSIVPQIFLGRSEQIQKHYTNSVGRSLFIVGTLSVIGILHLLVFSIHQNMRSALPFGVLCFLMVLRELLYGEMYMTALLPNLNFTLYIRLASLTYYLAFPIGTCYVHRVIPQHLNKKYVNWVWIISFPVIILGIFTSQRIYSQMTFLIHGLIFLAMVIITQAFYRYVRSGGKLASYFAFAWCGLAIAVIYDILYDPTVVIRGPFLPLALLVFAVVQAFYLYTNVTKTLQDAGLDYLTRVPNRGSLNYYGVRLLKEAEASNKHLSVLMFDIDHFKQINDSWGHQIGDEVLKAVAERAQNSIRQDDKLFRYGGDEFVVLLPDTELYEGRNIAERIINNVSNLPVELVDGKKISVEISVGLVMRQQHSKSIDDILDAADQTLYQAKLAGRNRIEINCQK